MPELAVASLGFISMTALSMYFSNFSLILNPFALFPLKNLPSQSLAVEKKKKKNSLSLLPVLMSLNSYKSMMEVRS